MEELYIKAYAKINLILEILNKRLDNYHNIRSIIQKISLYDELYIRKTDKIDFELKTNIKILESTDNIIYKAYLILKEKYNIKGIKVLLNKNIPIQAGLGGGSTDCASFILGINKLFDLNISFEEMKQIGKSLGADVVSCFYNSAVISEGIGNIITPINTDFKYYILIIKPTFLCNTKEMYEKLDKEKILSKKNNLEDIKRALEIKDINLLSKNLYNTFEEIVNVKDIKEKLINNKALNALLTGSGSCVFGIFENEQDSIQAQKVLKKEYQTYLCTSYNLKNNNE